MGKTRYATAVRFLKEIKKNKGTRVKSVEFLSEFKRRVGSDVSRTVKPYLILMRDFKLLTQENEYYIIGDLNESG